MPSSISISTRSPAWRASAWVMAHATSKTLWLAMPARTAPVVGGIEEHIEHALVVGVRLGLGRKGCRRPTVNLRVDPFHGEIRPFDQTDLHRRAAPVPALPCPRAEVLQGGQRVGQVGLQHDPRSRGRVGRLVEHPPEHRQGELQVAVLLHVEVDELGRVVGVGGVVEAPKPGRDALGPRARSAARPAASRSRRS